MAATKLDINLVETYNINTIGFADVSTYKNGPSGVTMTITPPGWEKVVVDFTPSSVNIYNATHFDINCDAESPLPDGLYELHYSVAPNTTTFIEKSFFRTALIKCKYARTRLAIDAKCDCGSSRESLEQAMSEIRTLIEGAVASANQCDTDTAYDKYRMADKMLNRLSACGC